MTNRECHSNEIVRTSSLNVRLLNQCSAERKNFLLSTKSVLRRLKVDFKMRQKQMSQQAYLPLPYGTCSANHEWLRTTVLM